MGQLTISIAILLFRPVVFTGTNIRSSSFCEGFTFNLNPTIHCRLNTRLFSSDPDPESLQWYNAELVDDIGEDGDEDDEDWLPDREKALRKRKFAQEYYAQAPTERVNQIKTPAAPSDSDDEVKRTPVYTEEEEELILAMGGRTGGKREPGYLGDSTLAEVAQDYSVPVCYLADVLCTWGVPVPINVHERLGDMVTGEQAFAILEAILTLDVAALQDRYSNNNLMEVCNYYDIELRDAFQMAIKEGWSVPFGVQTCLRVEQEGELLRVLGGSFVAPDNDDD
jgi:hypothetical protein